MEPATGTLWEASPNCDCRVDINEQWNCRGEMVVKEGVAFDALEWQKELRGLTEELREKVSAREKDREKGKKATGGESERHSLKQRERVCEVKHHEPCSMLTTKE
jgi:hypothetical protein